VNDTAPRRLGRRPVRHDPRTLHLIDYLLHRELPEPPASADWLSKVTTWPMMLNDRLGCCTCAAAGHMIEAWTAYGQHAEATVTDDQVLTAYEAVSGYDPSTGEGDNGAVELDVLRYWRKHGIAGHRIGAFVKVDHRDHTEVKQAISIFGGIYTGFEVSQSAMDQNKAGQVWDRSRTRAGRAILGGHAVPVAAYDADGLTCVTWGATQRMTWDFFDDYFTEAYAVITDDFLDPKTGLDPAGLDTKALLEDLAALGA
jgi:hypothetical protein